MPLHRTNYYDILFITKGGKSYKHCGLKKYEIFPGDIFFKAAGQITSGEIYSKDMEGYICLMEGDFISSHTNNNSLLSSFPFFKYGNYPIISLTTSAIDKFDFLFNNICQLFNSKSKSKNKLIASWLNVLLLESTAIYQEQNNSKPTDNKLTADKLTGKFKDLVAEHYLTKRQVNEYAQMLFVTPNHLNKIIKKTTGRTATNWIYEMVLLEAKLLLKHTEMNISEIAFFLSFDDASYFNRFFKKHTGITPLNFRKME